MLNKLAWPAGPSVPPKDMFTPPITVAAQYWKLHYKVINWALKTYRYLTGAGYVTLLR